MPRRWPRPLRRSRSRTSAPASSAWSSSALLDRTFEAARWLGARSVGIAGGVSANSRLRSDAEQRAERHGIPVFVPPLSLSTDNAAMIGAAALRKLQQGATGDYGFNAEASLRL